jgi:hypothetical protein
MATINGEKDPKVSPKKKSAKWKDVKKKTPAKKKAVKKKAPKKKAAAVDPEESKPVDANAYAVLTGSLAGKTGQGTTYLEKDGVEKHTTEFVPVFKVEDGFLTANVNVSSGARIGLPNYSDVRCGASLTIPCAAVPAEIDKAFEWAKEWVESRVQAMVDENSGGGG